MCDDQILQQKEIRYPLCSYQNFKGQVSQEKNGGLLQLKSEVAEFVKVTDKHNRPCN